MLDEPRCYEICDRRRHPDHDVTGRLLGGIAHRLPDVVRIPQDKVAHLDEAVAGFGRHDIVGIAQEQLDSQLRFEILYLTTERRLSDMKLASGCREAAEPGNGGEIAQLAKIHGLTSAQQLQRRPRPGIRSDSPHLRKLAQSRAILLLTTARPVWRSNTSTISIGRTLPQASHNASEWPALISCMKPPRRRWIVRANRQRSPLRLRAMK